MEMRKKPGYFARQLVQFTMCLWSLLLLVTVNTLNAQPQLQRYTVKNGKMYIELSKKLPETAIDSFISKYDLAGIALKKFLLAGFTDSLKKYGWEILQDDADRCIITKPLEALEHINEPGELMQLKDKMGGWDDRFPIVSNKVLYGSNRFRSSKGFRIIADSLAVFHLRNFRQAKNVLLAGNFNKWNPDSHPMKLTDSGWVALVKLSPGKYWYKFVADGEWIIDPDNRLTENDGEGNTNSVFYFTNHIFRLNKEVKKVFVTGSFNGWNENELLMEKTTNGWQLPVYLAEGTHTYRFIADGSWMPDPDNQDKFPNEFNDFNSVIRIGRPHLFMLPGFVTAKEVIVAGSFNNWQSHELVMKKNATGWELAYTLGPGNYEYRFRVDGKWLLDTSGTMADYEPANGPNPIFVIGANYTFRLKGFGDAKRVCLAGDFNNWTPHSFPMKREGDEWVLPVHLTTGKHLYKFVVDGNWILDAANSLWEQNEHGTGNSVLWFEK